MKLTYNVKDKPKFGQVIVFALQQLLAIMAATIAVPNIIGHGMSPAAALFGAGIGTLVYLLFTKFRSPVFLGSSFAFLGPMGAAFAGAASTAAGFAGLIIGAVLAGLVYVVIALIVKLAGVKWINYLMPAVVIGPTVAIIGLSLAGNAVGDLSKTNYALDAADYAIVATYTENDATVTKEVTTAVEVPEGATFAAQKDGEVKNAVAVTPTDDGFAVAPVTTYASIVCGLITLAVTMLCSVFGKKFLKMIPFIIGILAGCAAALVLTLIGQANGNEALLIMDLTKFANMQWIPDFTFLKAIEGVKEIDGAYIATLAVAYVPVAFVVFAEHIADHKNISSIIETDLLEDPGLHRTLLGDGIGSMAGAFFGGCPNTTYGESIGCVAISGNASIVTILTTAILAIVVSFLAPFSAFLASIPSCVMGGVCIALYGFIAVSGLKMVQTVDLGENKNLFVVSVILITGIGGLSLTFGKITITTVACALILGILTNLMLKKGGSKEQ